MHFCHLLFLAGTVLDVVFVVDVAVVVVVAAAVVVVVFVVAAGAGAVLFPLFICNHAQDHLAHLQKMTNIIKNIGQIKIFQQTNISVPPH